MTFRMTAQSYSDGTSILVEMFLYCSIVQNRTMPPKDCSPTKPKLRGKLVTVITHIEKTAHIIASQNAKILLESLIFHQKSPCPKFIQKSYEQKILTQNTHTRRERFDGNPKTGFRRKILILG